MKVSEFILLNALPALSPLAGANDAMDQLERAALLREFLEVRPVPKEGSGGASLPGASLGMERAAPSAPSARQFEESQWRRLLGNQQTQIHAPENHGIPAGQWRQQDFDRERRAQDLSADILRRSQEALSNSHR